MATAIMAEAVDPSAAADGGAIHHIRDDSTGGDCPQVGIWQPATLTCTLTTDSVDKFVIDDDYITLDGAGHSITGTGPDDPANFVEGPDGGGDAIQIFSKTGVTIKNIDFNRFDYSVHLDHTSHSTVHNISSSNTGLAGVSLSYSSYNTITGNTISNQRVNTGICIGYTSTNNLIEENDILDSAYGIYVHDFGTGNIISGNSLTRCGESLTFWNRDSGNEVAGNDISGGNIGIYIHSQSNGITVQENLLAANAVGLLIENASGNTIVHNSFRDNVLHISTSRAAGNSFSQPAPDGGNYWSGHGPVEGCADANIDGFCDLSYLAEGVTDSLPWVRDRGWICNKPALIVEVGLSYWGSFADYERRLLSVDWTIRNRGPENAYDIYLTGNQSTNGVLLETPVPALIGTLPGGASVPFRLRFYTPESVMSFRSVLQADATDLCGTTYSYPQPRVAP
ncbi:MAG: NosD domain-containing protein [Thermoleophilia bacterium]|nr:NosD domain-containing protein [Thermoleophilia bacterium]